MSKNSVDIILVKSATCPHCIRFDPVWKYTSENHNLTKQLGGSKQINFKSYDMVKQGEKTALQRDYTGLYEVVDGYPTALLHFFHDDKIRVVQVEHTSINMRGGYQDNNTNNIKLIKEASDKFLQNIINKYNTIVSNKKEVHINLQNGGLNENYSQSIYKEKYLKYKAKYLKLKNSE
jgi:hypothetical protein